MRFEIDNIVPPKTTHHSKRIVRAAGFAKLADSDALNAAKDFWTQVLLPYRPKEPMTGPIALSLTFRWPHNKSATKAFRSKWRWHMSKPDCSNMAKTVEDRLVALGFMQNDAQVCTLTVNKFWSETGGLVVCIDEVTAE